MTHVTQLAQATVDFLNKNLALEIITARGAEPYEIDLLAADFLAYQSQALYQSKVESDRANLHVSTAGFTAVALRLKLDDIHKGQDWHHGPSRTSSFLWPQAKYVVRRREI